MRPRLGPRPTSRAKSYIKGRVSLEAGFELARGLRTLLTYGFWARPLPRGIPPPGFHPSPVQFLSFFRPVTVLNLEPPPLISV